MEWSAWIKVTQYYDLLATFSIYEIKSLADNPERPPKELFTFLLLLHS